jgi:hypothetical protein
MRGMDEIMAGQAVALREQMVSAPPELQMDAAQWQYMPPMFGKPLRRFIWYGPGMPRQIADNAARRGQRIGLLHWVRQGGRQFPSLPIKIETTHSATLARTYDHPALDETVNLAPCSRGLHRINLRLPGT